MIAGNDDLYQLLEAAIDAAQKAAEIIRSHYRRSITVETKARGDSIASQVVTEVDRLAQAAIVETLLPICERYDLALLAEESADSGERLEKSAFWSIDPMDGTLAFIEQKPGFAVSIALVNRAGAPLLGVVLDPLSGDLFHAVRGRGAFKNGDALTMPPLDRQRPLILQTDPSFQRHPHFAATEQGLTEIAKRLHLPGARIRYAAGSVMTACAILQDANICYFKYPRTTESGGSLWDYAATSCLFHEAGGIASDIHGQPMELNRAASTFMNHRGILYAAPDLTGAIQRLAFGVDG